jgi:hypothetical protein
MTGKEKKNAVCPAAQRLVLPDRAFNAPYYSQLSVWAAQTTSYSLIFYHILSAGKSPLNTYANDHFDTNFCTQKQIETLYLFGILIGFLCRMIEYSSYWKKQ